MCLALIAIRQHAQYPIMVLSNRDEFYKRAMAPAHYWHDTPQVFAGQDLVGGGTWLGVARNGRFALVTNYRSPKDYDASLWSRGILVKDYLQNSMTPRDYIETIRPDASCYNLFNLIVGNLNEVIYYSNVQGKGIELKTGLYGLSNHLLDTPWYKVLRAKELFSQRLAQHTVSAEAKQFDALFFPILEDKSLAPDSLLPQTGLTPDLEKALSSIFVTLPQRAYGTRNSTVLLLAQDRIHFSEKVFEQSALTFSQNKQIIFNI